MHIVIYGAGAIGGLFAARLGLAGHTISAVARGKTLQVLQERGLTLQLPDGDRQVAIRAEQDPHLLGVQDIVILAVKSPALPSVAQHIAPLIGPDTLVITAMNGVPWWFFEAPGVPYHGTRLHSIDPDGALSRAIPIAQVIGCVVHLSSSAPQAGVIRLASGNRLILGEPAAAGQISARVLALVALLTQAGFEAVGSADVRSDIWYKLWGNMTMNPISAITGAMADKILDDPLVNAYCLNVMQEAASIGARIACPIAQSGVERNQITRKLGSFKTSMLQDVEAGKALEIDALVAVVREIGQLTGTPTPTIDSLLGLSRLFARTRGLYPAD